MTTLSMTDTAAAVDLSVERFRKVWPSWVKAFAFPKPTPRPGLTGQRVRYIWEAEAVETWKARRRAALGRDSATPDAANDEALAEASPPRVAHYRARLETLRERRA
jgi:hypothetical protein